jgi:hypothetical protein
VPQNRTSNIGLECLRLARAQVLNIRSRFLDQPRVATSDQAELISHPLSVNEKGTSNLRRTTSKV